MDQTRQKAERLSRAIDRLQEAVDECRQTGSKVVRDGALHRFELCAELAWKAVREHFRAMGYLGMEGLKPAMRKAFSHQLITDEQGWLALLNAQNQTPYLYNDDDTANTIYQAVESTYLPLLRTLSETLSSAAAQQ